MNLQEYQKISRQSAIYPGIGDNLWYPVLGIIGEYLEWKTALSSDDKFKEAGDFAWYCVQAFSEMNEDVAQLEVRQINQEDDLICLMRMSEGVKKSYRDGKTREKQNIIKENICHLWNLVIREDSQEKILQGNLSKIKDRKARKVLQGEGDSR